MCILPQKKSQKITLGIFCPLEVIGVSCREKKKKLGTKIDSYSNPGSTTMGYVTLDDWLDSPEPHEPHKLFGGMANADQTPCKGFDV